MVLGTKEQRIFRSTMKELHLKVLCDWAQIDARGGATCASYCSRGIKTQGGDSDGDRDGHKNARGRNGAYEPRWDLLLSVGGRLKAAI